MRRSPIQSIKLFCQACQGVPAKGDQKPIRDCPTGPDAPKHNQCALWPYRMGANPFVSEARKEAARRNAAVARSHKAQNAPESTNAPKPTSDMGEDQNEQNSSFCAVPCSPSQNTLPGMEVRHG